MDSVEKIKYKNFWILVVKKSDDNFSILVRHIKYKTKLLVCSAASGKSKAWSNHLDAIHSVMQYIDEHQSIMTNQIIEHENRKTS